MSEIIGYLSALPASVQVGGIVAVLAWMYRGNIVAGYSWLTTKRKPLQDSDIEKIQAYNARMIELSKEQIALLQRMIESLQGK